MEVFTIQKEGRKEARYCTSDDMKKGTVSPKNKSDAVFSSAMPSTLLRENEKIRSAVAVPERLISRETAASIRKSRLIRAKKQRGTAIGQRSYFMPASQFPAILACGPVLVLNQSFQISVPCLQSCCSPTSNQFSIRNY